VTLRVTLGTPSWERCGPNLRLMRLDKRGPVSLIGITGDDVGDDAGDDVGEV
jgi:hypothetical protein